MSKRNLIVVAVGAAALLVAGGVFASNMGFKLNYPLDGPGENSSKSGIQSIALPFNQQTSIQTALDLINDIEATAGDPTLVVNVARFDKTSDLPVAYGAGPSEAGGDFPLLPGEGYSVTVRAGTNYIIVGSHDPGFVVNLDGPGTNGSASGITDYAYPYHSTAATALDLINEIEAATGDTTLVVGVSRFDRTSDLPVAYGAGPSEAGGNFPLVPGESYKITVRGNGSFVPSHY